MKKIQVAALLSLAVCSVALGQQAVQWKLSDGGNGHWYQFVIGQTTSWDAAQLAAAARGGYLASVTSQAESDFVVAVCSNSAGWISYSGYLVGPWLGGYQPPNSVEPAGNWAWVSGEAWGWTNWWAATSEPNNGCAGHEDYLMLLTQPPQSGPSGWWNDAAFPDACGGASPKSSVVEWSADCNGDGIVDYGPCRDGSLPDYNGNNIPDCCEQGTPCVVGSFPVQWRVSDGGNGHWYAVSALSTDCWDQARSAADSSGGYLATLTSAPESQFLANLLRRVAGSNVAVGGFKDLSTGLWTWVTDEPWQYTNWQSGEPGCCLPNEWWLDVNSSTGRWRDRVQCITESVAFPGMMVTEWSADCNSDGVVDLGQILSRQLDDSNSNGVPDVCECASSPGLPACCAGNLNDDPAVDGADLGILLNAWGTCAAPCAADLNRDGFVDGADLGTLLGNWGACP
jgi:hypothetical protein